MHNTSSYHVVSIAYQSHILYTVRYCWQNVGFVYAYVLILIYFRGL